VAGRMLYLLKVEMHEEDAVKRLFENYRDMAELRDKFPKFKIMPENLCRRILADKQK